jgi:MoaA/NifB/PqqE/SkfB family radical SAM enzyme
MDVLRRLGVMEIVFSGGNPLMRDDIHEILDYASKYFITTIYDNGSMAVNKIDALRDVDFVAISLDTLDEEKNDYMKGVSGAWGRAINAVETLQKEEIPVGISPTISQFNLYEIEEFTKHFIDLGVPVWYCLYWYDYPTKDRLFGIGRKNDEFEITDMENMVKLCDTLLKMKKQGIFITKKTLFALKQLFQNGKRTWNCKALQNFLMIDPNGRVAGCHCREPVASVFDLLDVWDSPKFESLRKEYNKCNRCAYLCYIFYSIHESVLGNIEILRDQWKNAKFILRQNMDH